MTRQHPAAPVGNDVISFDTDSAKIAALKEGMTTIWGWEFPDFQAWSTRKAAINL